MDINTAIYTEKLIKSYGSVRALRGVDLEVRKGEIFGFLGPNGAGKTTTIRCLLDLIRPDSGIVRVLGFDPQKNPVEVRARVGYLPGELHFDESMTVEGALRFLNRLRNGDADWERVRRIAERLDLDIKPAIRNLSKGNKQKLGLVQALMHRPELLLLDEPTFGLDPLVQREVLKLIVEEKEEGTMIFFSSHILSEVHEIAERVGIIRKGVIVEVAETAALINRTINRVRVRFKKEVDPGVFAHVPGVEVIGHDDGSGLYLQVRGDMDALIKELSHHPVLDLETERPSLEEIFLTYYQADTEQEA